VPDDSARRDSRLSGFYAVLDRDDPDLAEQLLASARVLQVRIKPGSAADILAASRRAREITRRQGAMLIVNDRVDLALAAGADGVHLGQDDLPLAAARALVPRGFVIGISTHDLAQVRAAVDGGADYLGYGPVFATTTKENPDPVQGTQALARAVETAGIPVVAIGGITPETAAACAAAGAAAACAISAVNRAADVIAAGQAIARAWPRAG
jgi:thiamine-phosphate pyrophosphorylase